MLCVGKQLVEELLMTMASSGLLRFRERPEILPGDQNPFRLVSTLAAPVSASVIREAFPGHPIPNELARAWQCAGEATLCEDVEYGQWGLHLLAPADAARRTRQEMAAQPNDYRPLDIVVGEFLGDQELLVLAADTPAVLVALPLYPRPDWILVGWSFDDFLLQYFEAEGAKYWES
jgi:hypothetical protein